MLLVHTGYSEVHSRIIKDGVVAGCHFALLFGEPHVLELLQLPGPESPACFMSASSNDLLGFEDVVY